MLAPLEAQAVALYREGKHLREVANELGRSHEWVRKTLARANEPIRGRGRESVNRPDCRVCGKTCSKVGAKFCSRECMQKNRLDTAMEKLDKAIVALKEGSTYAEAAKVAGFKSGWHLWGRLHHFGLTEGLSQLEDDTNKPS